MTCMANSAISKIHWDKLFLVIYVYNNIPHALINFPLAYLLCGQLLYDCSFRQNVYPPVNEALRLSKDLRTRPFQN